MEKERKKMWQYPWGYRESVAVVAAVVAMGWLLQVVAGGFDFSLLRFPVSLIAAGSILLIVALLGLRRRSAFAGWLSGVPMSVTLICTFVVLGIVMGLVPQVPSGAVTPESKGFGFEKMTSSWAFALVYLLTLLSLGVLLVRRLATFRLRDYAFYLNHAGLWIVLLAAGLGSADMKRYVMHIREGETEWRVYSEDGRVLDLPVAIGLKDFRMEEYPPKLAVIDRTSGSVLPEGKPAYFQIDEKEPDGMLGEWQVHLLQYIHEAVRHGDSTYREAPMPGATPAARVEVRNRSTDERIQGWVCAGNAAQLYMTLNLDDRHAMVMTGPEPRRYVSDIEVYTEEGRQSHALLEVNKPLRMGAWMFYQYGYDKGAGKMSSYTSIELVYDPWLVPVYVGLALLMAGSVCMLWSGRKRKETKDDVE